MRVFLVGATGVIGRALIPRLIERGDTVVALVRSIERAQFASESGVTLAQGDLLEIAPQDLASLLDGCDAAMHLATALRPGSPGLGTTNTNATLRGAGTRRLLDAVVTAGVGRYVQQSIVMAYPDSGDVWIDESTPFDQSPARAGMSRPVVEMEAMVHALEPARVAWTILRGGSFVGPDTFQDDLIRRLRDGSARVPGDGSNWVSFVHVADYAEAVARALHDAPPASTFNITDEPIRNGEYLDRLAGLVGAPPPARDSEAALPSSYRCSSQAARQQLDWRPVSGIWPTSA